MNFFTPFLENVSVFFSADPSVLLVQSAMVFSACVIVFLVLFATRDILLRSHSLSLQIVCILLVALLPVVGFLLYLLIRPSRTVAERSLERRVQELTAALHKKGKQEVSSKK